MTESEQEYRFGLRVSEYGYVSSIGDGIVWIHGLPSARLDELVELEDGSLGMLFQLEKNRLGAILLSQSHGAKAGIEVRHIERKLDIPVGDGLLGRVIDPLGRALDDLPLPEFFERRPLESPAPAILERDFVNQPFYTGCKIVDALIPIGKGQRQLIIGDDGTGKTSLALDTVINQQGRNLLCVLILIGQPRSSVAAAWEVLRAAGALEYTVIVVAEANSLPGLRYLAPFAGCAVAEYWMRQGRDTLVIYDDLTRHAQAYRELSLLLQRPPGREAYPGDIFYLHSRLLERATALAKNYGGGSMTALPIIETRQGELSAYIPTNLISITDGQIYLESKLFAAGNLPAIDIGRSVSRIGGKAQHRAIKNAAAHIRLDYLQFLELELYARFGTRLEASMEQKLRNGRLLREILKQDRLQPVSEVQHLAWLLAYSEGLLNNIEPEQALTLLTSLFRDLPAGMHLDTSKDIWLAYLRQHFAA
jgi:F-type H+/Na+-transporting ATPase subunit alpha